MTRAVIVVAITLHGTAMPTRILTSLTASLFIIGLSVAVLVMPPAASAQDLAAPPVPGRVILDNSLTQPGLIETPTCPVGLAGGEATPEGYLIRLRGRCATEDHGARGISVDSTLPGLTVPDGEIRFDFKILSGQERVALAVGARIQPRWLPAGYGFYLYPSDRLAQFARVESGTARLVAPNTRLRAALRLADWNSVAMRMRGSQFWLLVNEEVILSAQDEVFERGTVRLVVARAGDPSDDAEVAVLLRNLTVSAVEGAPEDRAPMYAPPGPVPAQIPEA